jgi:hypothetical protein
MRQIRARAEVIATLSHRRAFDHIPDAQKGRFARLLLIAFDRKQGNVRVTNHDIVERQNGSISSAESAGMEAITKRIERKSLRNFQPCWPFLKRS